MSASSASNDFFLLFGAAASRACVSDARLPRNGAGRSDRSWTGASSNWEVGWQLQLPLSDSVANQEVQMTHDVIN